MNWSSRSIWNSLPLAPLFPSLFLLLGFAQDPPKPAAPETVIPESPAAELGPAADVPMGQRVYLTRERASRVESYVRVVNNRGWNRKPMQMGGQSYKRGLGVHSFSSLDYALNGGFQRFHVIPGASDSHHGLLEMKIFLDGVQVYKSGQLRKSDTPPEPIELSVKDAKILTLVVDPLGPVGGDHANWAEAWLQPVAAESSDPDKPVHEPVAFRGTVMSRRAIKPFLQTYCIGCHGERKQRGQVRFDEIDWSITNNDSAQRWQDVLDQLNGGDMPPEDEDQPTPRELSRVLDTLTKTLVKANQRLTDHGGEIKMRRLNRREYANTVEHLFGFTVAPNDIPENAESEHFDTVGEEQFFSSADFEKYLTLGRKIASEALHWNTQKHRERKVSGSEPEKQHTDQIRKKLAELDRQMAMKKAGATWQEMGFKDEGEAEILFQQFDSRAEHRRLYLEYPDTDRGVYLNEIVKSVSTSRHVDPRGEYILRARGGIVGNPDPIRTLLKVSTSQGIRGTLQLRGTADDPGAVEIRVRQPIGNKLLSGKFVENMPNFTRASGRTYRRRVQGGFEKEWTPWASLWIDRAEIDGPMYPETGSFLETVLYPDRPVGEGRSEWLDEKKVTDLLHAVATEAFRRQPPSPEYLQGLHQLYLDQRAQGIRHKDAITECLAIILASPGFLYLQENEMDARTLTRRERAIRLAYFLWSAPPDEALYAADLTQPTVLAAEVDRMLADPKAIGFRDGFIGQWAEFDRFDAITVEELDHFRFNDGVRHAAKQEVREFFGTLIAENLPVKTLIDSDFVTINPTLAIHYGLPGVHAPDDRFQKVTLPAASPLGGFMTQAAFLITGSNGERSSPVIRGALVMEKLLDDKPAPPPPNVPELGSATGVARSNREMVELHQQQAVCASCHKKMDVIGFGLENFDTVGRWRNTERVGGKDVPIEPGGTLPGGVSFGDIQELKEALGYHEADLARGFLESLLSYGLGRTIEFSDADDVAAMLAKLEPDGYRVRDMIRAVALSPLFSRR